MEQKPHCSPAPDEGRLWKAVCSAASDLMQERDLTRALVGIIRTVTHDLGLDRVGIFLCDQAQGQVRRLVGIDPHGDLEYDGDYMPTDGPGPLEGVIRGEIPYFHTHDIRTAYPDIQHPDGVRAVLVVPLVCAGEILGAMAADNLLTGRDIPDTMIQPLCVFAQFAAQRLSVAVRQEELALMQVQKRDFYRDVVCAVTNGKLVLCTETEIERAWPDGSVGHVEIDHEGAIRRAREQVTHVGKLGGMSDDRLYDLGLCTSEAATNALIHASGGSVEATLHDCRVLVRVIDRGPGIESGILPKATLMAGFSTKQSLGRGFTLMNELADKLYLCTRPTGTELIIEMGVKPPGPPDLASLLAEWGEDE